MSRVQVLGLDHYVTGELAANVSRSWAINEGGQTTITLTAAQMRASGLDFGRLVYVTHPRLPAWAGVVDTPWRASIPGEATVYNAGYLLRGRCPEAMTTLSGSVGSVVGALVEMANAQGDLYVRLGQVDEGPATVEKINLQDLWTQLVGVVKRAGMEMMLRPERDGGGRVMIYVDVREQMGVETGALLHDGVGGNFVAREVTVDGEIWNRVRGYGTQQKPLRGNAVEDAESAGRWGLRSKAVQFASSSVTLLDGMAAVEVEKSRPRLIVSGAVLDSGGIFNDLRPGNDLSVRLHHVILPGGAAGWSGRGRIMGMVYEERENTVNLTLEAEL